MTTSDVTLDCGGGIILRPPRLTDASAIAQHANDRDIWINLRDLMPHPYSLEDARDWIGHIQMQSPRVNFVIDVNGEAVGAIGLVLGNDIERCSAEVGYWIGAAHWGRGIATNALRRLCRYAFEGLALQRVFATPIARNPSSCRVLEKAGFEREGLMRRACIKDGKVMDMALYAKVPD